MDIRLFATIGLLLSLGGCGMSSGMAALSYTMNGISYVSSGKGVADHALSAAADKDCAVLRAVQGVDICASDDGGKGETLMTMIESTPVADGSTAVSPAGEPHGSASAPMAGGAGKAGPAGDARRAAVAMESIYGQSR